jgi:pseudouridine-5'-phosphate glycosidase
MVCLIRRNMLLSTEMDAAIRKLGAVPATIAVIDGEIIVGVSQLAGFWLEGKTRKLSSRSRLRLSRKRRWNNSRRDSICAHRAGVRVLIPGIGGGVTASI